MSNNWRNTLTLLLNSADSALLADVPAMTEAELFALFLFLSRLYEIGAELNHG